jgi:hypothetical protein
MQPMASNLFEICAQIAGDENHRFEIEWQSKVVRAKDGIGRRAAAGWRFPEDPGWANPVKACQGWSNHFYGQIGFGHRSNTGDRDFSGRGFRDLALFAQI